MSDHFYKHRYIYLIIIIGVIVYFNALFNGFVWDDEEQIVNNVAVQSLTNIPSLFFGSTFNTGGTGTLGGVYYRPVMMVLFSVLYAITGPHAFLFHFVQIGIHIALAVLLFQLFKRYFAEYIALFLSIVFLVHPVNVESVSYIAAIQDVLYAFFALIAMRIGMNVPKRNIIRHALQIAGVFFLALLSKEVAVLAMGIFIFHHIIFRHRIWVLYTFLLGLISGLYALMRFGFAGVFFSAFHFAPIVQLPFIARLMMSPYIFLTYVGLFIWPHKLAVMQHWVFPTPTITTFWIPLAGALALVGTVGYVLYKSKDKTLLFFSAWFFISLFPYLQLFPLDMTIAERWFYVPMIGLLGMIGWIISRIWPTRPPRYAIVGGVCIILVLSVRTIIRNTDWKDSMHLFAHDVQISRNAFDLENNAGVAYFRAQDYQKAGEHFAESTRLAPKWWVNWSNLGAVEERQGNLDKAADYYRTSIENGDYYLAYENYAGVLLKQKRNKEALTFLKTEALPRFPYNGTLRQLYEYALSQPH